MGKNNNIEMIIVGVFPLVLPSKILSKEAIKTIEKLLYPLLGSVNSMVKKLNKLNADMKETEDIWDMFGTVFCKNISNFGYSDFIDNYSIHITPPKTSSRIIEYLIAEILENAEIIIYKNNCNNIGYINDIEQPDTIKTITSNHIHDAIFHDEELNELFNKCRYTKV